MRFKEFLAERTIDISLKQLLERDCKPFLDQAGDNLLWRGSKTLQDKHQEFTTVDGFGVYKVPRREQRKPRNTTPISSDAMDDFFEKKFGWRPRSEAVFCQGDPKGTSFYGTTFCIFPIGEFEFVWSPEYEDLFGALSVSYTRIRDDMTPEEQAVRKAQLVHSLEEGEYRDDDLRNAMAASGGQTEIMIGCKEYYAITYKDAVAAFNLSDEP